jgi:hypothetical protein
MTSIGAFADEASDCATHGGTYMTGIVVAGPMFKPGGIRAKRGLRAELSHTHFSFTLDGDISGQPLDVAVDNVFASGYDSAPHQIPVPLNTIKVGDHIDMCGQEYAGGDGIHFVHTNCGDKPTAQDPNGWFKIINPDQSVGPNLESNTEYCRLWP